MELRSPFEERDGQIAIDLPGAHALFTTRSWGDVRETGAQISERLGVRLARTQQVHGSQVITVAPAKADVPVEADAILTSTVGVAPTVITADCLPIVIASRGAVGAVHAGWRGLDAGLIAKAVAALRELCGGV